MSRNLLSDLECEALINQYCEPTDLVVEQIMKRMEREMQTKNLFRQIDSWEKKTRAELAAHEELEKLPNFGRF